MVDGLCVIDGGGRQEPRLSDMRFRREELCCGLVMLLPGLDAALASMVRFAAERGPDDMLDAGQAVAEVTEAWAHLMSPVLLAARDNPELILRLLPHHVVDDGEGGDPDVRFSLV